jgi:hypothetical protein
MKFRAKAIVQSVRVRTAEDQWSVDCIDGLPDQMKRAIK